MGVGVSECVHGVSVSEGIYVHTCVCVCAHVCVRVCLCA